MNNNIEINGKKYRRKTLEILTGGKGENISDDVLLIAWVFDHPNELTMHLEEILKLKKLKRVRYALLRMQVECQLHMNEDMEGYSKKLWIAKILEKALFGSLLFEGSEE